MGSPRRLPKIVILRRRRDYLARQIAQTAENEAQAWDKAELAAIEWAIQTLVAEGHSDDKRDREHVNAS